MVWVPLEVELHDRISAMDSARREVSEGVRRFYEELPFNSHETTAAAARSIRRNVIPEVYPDLHERFAQGGVRTVLELGCGTGWLAATLALHYPVQVVAVDFCSKAVESARALADELALVDRLSVVHSDLFEHRSDVPVDLVVSLGVLHHTGDAAGALRHALGSVREHGHAYIGLYHEPGRRVFLELMREQLEAGGEAAAAALYKRLDGARQHTDVHLDSWFRDQVLHPHETQHTLRQVVGWLAGTGFEVVRTSLNRFQPIRELEALFVEELAYEARAREVLLKQGRFFPGFFTFLARHGRG